MLAGGEDGPPIGRQYRRRGARPPDTPPHLRTPTREAGEPFPRHRAGPPDGIRDDPPPPQHPRRAGRRPDREGGRPAAVLPDRAAVLAPPQRAVRAVLVVPGPARAGPVNRPPPRMRGPDGRRPVPRDFPPARGLPPRSPPGDGASEPGRSAVPRDVTRALRAGDARTALERTEGAAVRAESPRH